MDDFNRITEALQSGGIAVVRTDTLYGIIALAENEVAVERVFDAKNRDRSKQCIVLLADSDDAPSNTEIISKFSGESSIPTSVIIPATSEPEWLLRGGDSMAYRVVRDPFLKSVVAAVGPVIAPSANPEGLPPARTIAEAKAYFGDQVAVYVDGGEVPEQVQASRMIKVSQTGAIEEVRA